MAEHEKRAKLKNVIAALDLMVLVMLVFEIMITHLGWIINHEFLVFLFKTLFYKLSLILQLRGQKF